MIPLCAWAWVMRYCDQSYNIMPTPGESLNVFCPRPDCAGEILQKRSKKGRVFYGCNQYPACDFVTWNRPSDQEKCEVCGYPMGEKILRGKVAGATGANLLDQGIRDLKGRLH